MYHIWDKVDDLTKAALVVIGVAPPEASIQMRTRPFNVQQHPVKTHRVLECSLKTWGNHKSIMRQNPEWIYQLEFVFCANCITWPNVGWQGLHPVIDDMAQFVKCYPEKACLHTVTFTDPDMDPALLVEFVDFFSPRKVKASATLLCSLPKTDLPSLVCLEIFAGRVQPQGKKFPQSVRHVTICGTNAETIQHCVDAASELPFIDSVTVRSLYGANFDVAIGGIPTVVIGRHIAPNILAGVKTLNLSDAKVSRISFADDHTVTKIVCASQTQAKALKTQKLLNGVLFEFE